MTGPRDGAHPVEAISALADGELVGAELAAVEAHLEGCASCRALLEDFRFLAQAVPEAATDAPPAGIAARVRERLDAEGGIARRRRFVLPVAAAATLAAVALLATLQYRRVPPEPVSAPRPAEKAMPGLEAPAPPPPPPPARASEPEAPRRSRANVRPGGEPAPAPEPAPVPRERDFRADEAPVVPEEREAAGLAGAADASAPAAAAPRSSETLQKAAKLDVASASAIACAAPWHAPGAYAWAAESSESGAAVIAGLARAEGGDAVTGGDARGEYVTLRVPAAAWPSLVARLRAAGARVPEPAPAPPPGAACVTADVRLEPPASR